MLTDAMMVGSTGDMARSLTDCLASDVYVTYSGYAYIAMAYQRLWHTSAGGVGWVPQNVPPRDHQFGH